MNLATWKSIGLGVLAAALQALIQALLQHHAVDPVTSALTGVLTGGAFAAKSPYPNK